MRKFLFILTHRQVTQPNRKHLIQIDFRRIKMENFGQSRDSILSCINVFHRSRIRSFDHGFEERKYICTELRDTVSSKLSKDSPTIGCCLPYFRMLTLETSCHQREKQFLIPERSRPSILDDIVKYTNGPLMLTPSTIRSLRN